MCVFTCAAGFSVRLSSLQRRDVSGADVIFLGRWSGIEELIARLPGSVDVVLL